LFAQRKCQWEVFFARLQASGCTEGRNVRCEIRAPEAAAASFDEPIAELARLKFDVIVATGSKAALAAKRGAPNIAMVLSPTQDAAREAAPQLQLDLLPIEVNPPEAMPAAFEAAVKARAQSMIVTMDPFFFGQSKEISALSLKHRLPPIQGLAVGATGGALMAYGPNDTDSYRIAAEFVDKILRGAKPAELPIQQPTKWELVINLQTAKALGVPVPKALLQQADRLIE